MEPKNDDCKGRNGLTNVFKKTEFASLNMDLKMNDPIQEQLKLAHGLFVTALGDEFLRILQSALNLLEIRKTSLAQYVAATADNIF